jgi:hypothetical protein
MKSALGVGSMALHDLAQPQLLTSWKEIASYLGKGVRTVQRWEQQFGLPVLRPNERSKGIVRADPGELDRWLQVQWSQRSNVLPNLTVARSTAECVGTVRANIQQAAILRQATRALLEDVRASLSTTFAECQSLARNMAPINEPN